MSESLRIKAETQDDLTILSSALQDAIVRVGEIRLDAKARSLTLRLTRFRRETPSAERVLAGVRFDGVLSVAAKGINRGDPDAFAVLIAVKYAAGDTAPEGDIHLVFAGGGELKLKTECIDVILADVSPPRPTKLRPLHPLD